MANIFSPVPGANQVVSATSTSANITVAAGAVFMRVVNSGANIAYVRLGVGSATATVADIPVLPNSDITISIASAVNRVAYISAAGTTLNIQPCN